MGGGIGGSTGALIGGIVGSVVPGIGTAIGIAAGSGIDAAIGVTLQKEEEQELLFDLQKPNQTAKKDAKTKEDWEKA